MSFFVCLNVVVFFFFFFLLVALFLSLLFLLHICSMLLLYRFSCCYDLLFKFHFITMADIETEVALPDYEEEEEEVEEKEEETKDVKKFVPSLLL